MADFALTFADGADAYAFTHSTDFNPAFSRMQNIITALPGAHGGYDANHNEEARSQGGNLDVRFVLAAPSTFAMQNLIDQVTALPTLGRRKLYYQPQGVYTERWCWARVENVQLGMKAVDGLLLQRVRVKFDVPDPFWRHDEENTAQACSGTSTDITVTNSGNAVALARVAVACGAAQTCENPTIKRTVGGVDLDILTYTGTVGNNETLTFDAARKSVDLDDTGVYADLTYEHPDWLRLAPGSNTLTVEFENGGDAATVTVYWNDTFRS